MNKEARMKELIAQLNQATKVYTLGEASIPDRKWDALFAELIVLELETGIQLPDSPTISAGFDDAYCKVEHSQPILSLKSTKDEEDLVKFLKDKEGVLSWKLDGISVVLYYRNGKLVSAATRGNGQFGKDIFKKVQMLHGVPKKLNQKIDAVVRGEAVCRLDTFEQIRNTKQGERYSNPRSLVAGLLNPSSRTHNTLLKQIWFIAHTPVELHIDEVGAAYTLMEQLRYLKDLGFEVDSIDPAIVTAEDVLTGVNMSNSIIDTCPFPVDGLVLTFNDLHYGQSLGHTNHHPKHSIAYKWKDICKESMVTGVKWSVSRTGLITPVVQFDPIELEGTTVSQANLHSLKIFEDLMIGKGDILQIYKANKMIPAVQENLTRSGKEKYPKKCPECGKKTHVHKTDKTRKLYCYRCVK